MDIHFALLYLIIMAPGLNWSVSRDVRRGEGVEVGRLARGDNKDRKGKGRGKKS
jgi:hypothetical protein